MPVWFLPELDASDKTIAVTIPAGYALFVPLHNEFQADIVGSVLLSFTQNQAKLITKELDALAVPTIDVDGVPVADITRYRVQTPVFSFILPDAAVLKGYPTGSPLHMQAIGEGYNVIFSPLSVGKHVIRTQAQVVGDRHTLLPVSPTYQITVQKWPQ